MRQPSLTLLFLLLPLVSTVQAEEPVITPPAVTATTPSDSDTRISELERQLADSQRQRNELNNQLEGSLADRENAQMARLLQDNQKLKLQLREALSKQSQNPLNERQTWFLIGGAASLIGVLIGALLRGSRKSRRQWIN